MRKLSKLYLTDSDDIDPDVRERIDALYLPKLKNMNYENPKVLVVFSGGNAIGKSTLSKKIADDFHGVILENDGIKRVISELWPTIDKMDRNRITWQYSVDLYRRLPTLTNNGLAIRDGLIDWYYERLLPIFLDAGYKLFIVQYEISREKLTELIKKRGDTPTVTVERLLLQLEDHAIHQQRFRSDYTANVVLDEASIFDHDKVIATLRNYLDELSVS